MHHAQAVQSYRKDKHVSPVVDAAIFLMSVKTNFRDLPKLPELMIHVNTVYDKKYPGLVV
jgi:hypothetical protein